MYDSRFFKHTFVYSKVQNLRDGGFHLIGDSAYPICPFLMTPYRDFGLLTVRQSNYNYRLFASRVMIQNAFGILKQRFRQLKCWNFILSTG
jgi:hypothetical protein